MLHEFTLTREAARSPGLFRAGGDLREVATLADTKTYMRTYDGMCRWLSHAVDGQLVDRLGLSALPIPSDVRALAEEALALADATRIDARAIARLWLNAGRIERARREVEPLWPLVALGAVYDCLPPRVDPVGELRRLFRVEGVSVSVWRLVARHGFAGIRGVCEVASGDRLIAIADWCAALSDAQADWLPPVEVIRALYASVEPDDRGRRPISRPRFAGIDVPFLRAALRAAREHARAGTLGAFLDDELPMADQWWRATWPRLDGNQQHSGWSWILRRAGAWQAAIRQRLALSGEPLCRPALTEFSNGRFQAKALTTALALFDEGCAMRNCLHGYAGRVSKGDVLIYAIRPIDGQGVATSAEFRRDYAGRWNIAMARAFANQHAPGTVLVFCEALADAINQARDARRARMAQAIRRDRDRHGMQCEARHRERVAST